MDTKANKGNSASEMPLEFGFQEIGSPLCRSFFGRASENPVEKVLKEGAL